MNKPLSAPKPGAAAGAAENPAARILPMKLVIYKTGRSILPSTAIDLTGYRFTQKDGERSLLDYLLIGLLTLLAHFFLVRGFHDAASHEAPLTPVKVPPMVQVTLLTPPKPIVEPPPPPPPPQKKIEPPPLKKAAPPPPKKDVVALKPQPPKPKPPPKQVVQRVQPPPEPETVAEVDDDPPPAPVKAAPPPPPVVEKVTPPSGSAGYLHNPAPEYPSIAEEEGWEGRVILKVHVLASGRPDSVTVQKSSGHDVLDQAAVRTVKGSWHFAPAKRGDTPTDGWVSVPIVFNLPG
jgi:protein TonB